MMVSGHLREKNGYYHAVLNYVDDNGKRVTKWTSTRLPIKGNRKRAEEFLINLRMNANPTQASQRILFSEYMLQWLESVKPTIAPSTYSSYKNIVQNSVVPYFEKLGVELTKVKASHIQIYYDYLFEQGISANTIIHHHANIRKALQAAYQRDLISDNPADKVQRPKKDTYIAQFYSVEECNRLLEIAKGSTIEIPVILTLFYGFRRSEILGLRWSAVDFDNKQFL